MKTSSVKVVIVNAHHPGEVLVLEKERDDLPGGSKDPGEKNRDAALREAQEEIPGAQIYSLTKLPGSFRQALGGSATKKVVFYAALAEFSQDEQGEEVFTVSHEHTGARWIPRQNVFFGTMPRVYKIAILAREQIFRDLEASHAREHDLPLPFYEDEVLSA